MNSEDIIENEVDACLNRHKRERKDLQAEIQKLKGSISKGDKKKKKEVTTQIAIIEQQLDTRHEEELKNVREAMESKKISESLAEVKIADQSEGSSDSNPTNDETPEQNIPRVSKTQKRKAKKEQKDAEASERIRQGEIDGMFSERKLEEESFRKILSNRRLDMCQIPSNGDCLTSTDSETHGQAFSQPQLDQSLQDFYDASDKIELNLKLLAESLLQSAESRKYFPFSVQEVQGAPNQTTENVAQYNQYSNMVESQVAYAQELRDILNRTRKVKDQTSQSHPGTD